MKTGIISKILPCFLFLGLLTGCGYDQPQPQKCRAVVFTDGEVDDMDSFIRLLMYSNDIKLEGLIYTSSEWHYAGDGKGTLFTSEMGGMPARYGERTDLRWTGTTWMEEMIDEYAVSWPNLVKNDSSYPSPESLKEMVKIGNIKFEGEMNEDTEGSEYVKKLILDDNPEPIYMLIWGGTNTLASALRSIEAEYSKSGNWKEIYQKVSEKVIIYAVLDQDATYQKYVSRNWPDIKVIYNSAQFWAFAYMWKRAVPDEMQKYMDGEWFAKYIKFNHGPLMSHYFLWGDGQKIEGDPEHTQGDLAAMEEQNRRREEMARERGAGFKPAKQYDFISEGDSPSYFFLLDFGLRSTEDFSYGGLGGRFVRSKDNPARWEDGRDVADFNPYTDTLDSSYPQTRWVEVLQNDFAARADWCVNDFENANHRPEASVKGSSDIEAKPGSKVKMNFKASDPDGDTVTPSFWQYKEAGTYPGEVQFAVSANSVTVSVPSDAQPGQTIHVIMQFTDNGEPNLTNFRRVILTIS